MKKKANKIYNIFNTLIKIIRLNYYLIIILKFLINLII